MMVMPGIHQEQEMRLETFREEEETDSQDEGSVVSEDAAEKEKIRIAQNESKAVCCLRFFLVAVLVVVAAGVSLAVYYFTTSSEYDDFETQYTDHANKIVSAFQSNAARRLRALDQMAFGISSYAISENLTWPNVTIPDLERRAQYTLDLADVISITLLPIVTNQTRLGWEAYSVANQGWLTEGLAIQAQQEAVADASADTADEAESLALLDDIAANSADLKINDQIIRIEGTGSVNETGPGPFLPWWQFAPAFPFSTVVNYNTLSHPTRIHQLTTVMQTQQTLVSKAWDYRDTEDPETVGRKAVLNLFLNRWHEGGNNYEDGPVSDVYVPIFDTVDIAPRSKELVAMLTAYVYWQVYFENILPDNAQGVLAVLENTCANNIQQAFTYKINGKKAEYIGPGDLHDAKYDHLGIRTGYPAFLQGSDASLDNLWDGQCLYNLRVYPTQQLEDSYTTTTPLIFTLVIVATFLFTSMVFILYDWIVERRQRIVMKKAVQSTEVVNTLFPEAVRDRLFEENDNDQEAAMKKKLGDFASGDLAQLDASQTSQQAIADVYRECTVLFADIAGFTSWSNGRNPADVFMLLESIYGLFDRKARKRGVFKIETIGDCYLAVTGLPTPQKDHAVIMTKFASECMISMNQLIHEKLVNTLGEETTKLNMRFGLHSGEVTAGVLRGERARFQLFGDTVNTASRMESTGVPGKIQASMATAQLLIAAGKSSWVLPREDGVEAKGKGIMNTVWLQPVFDRPVSVSTFHTHTVSSSTSSTRPKPLLDLELGTNALDLSASNATNGVDDVEGVGAGKGKDILSRIGVKTDVEV